VLARIEDRERDVRAWAYIDRETAQWGKVVREAAITAE